jgi:uncharacterized protein (TIGR02266 family)
MGEMDPDAGAASQRRGFPRVPLRAKVRMEFAEQRCFLSEWAVNLSPGGMFVRSEAPVAPGQRFHFEAGLTTKGPRFEGNGEVLWVRREWEGSARPPGFAVRFRELQEEGRSILLRLADVFLAHGVAAMQEELQAMSVAWQRRRLDDESTDVILPDDQIDEPLPDTAVLQAPWLGLDDDIGTVATDDESVKEASAGSGDVTREAAAPAGQPVDEPPGEPSAPEARPAADKRRVWWVGVLALVLGGTVFLALRGPLSSPVVADTPAEGVAAALPAAPPDVLPAGAREGAMTFAGIDDVSWREDAQGLWVLLTLDGALPADALRHFRPTEEPPREVIQLLGARRGYAPAVVPVHSPLLEQIRVGFHPASAADRGADGDELRVVLDLTSAAVVVRQVQSDGHEVRLLLARDEAGSGGQPTEPGSEAGNESGAEPAAAAPSRGTTPASNPSRDPIPAVAVEPATRGTAPPPAGPASAQ